MKAVYIAVGVFIIVGSIGLNAWSASNKDTSTVFTVDQGYTQKIFSDNPNAEVNWGIVASQIGDQQVIVYSHAVSSKPDSVSKNRRLALSNALSIRAALIKRGLRSTHIHIRALGSKFKKQNLVEIYAKTMGDK